MTTDSLRTVGWLTPRRIATIALLVATVGLAIPYGNHDQHTIVVLPLEWGVTAGAAVAVVALILELYDRWREPPWAFLVSGVVWSFVAVYELFVADMTVLDHVGNALPSFGWAVLSLLVWREVVVAQRRERARGRR